MGFSDHFSVNAEGYAAFRPVYPKTLAESLARETPGQDLAWDCATGNGQAAALLSGLFRRVVATDASAAQIAHATPAPHVEYRVADASASGLPDHSCDLVTVAQALHWFDLDVFYAEVRRVLKPGGVIAAWTYEGCHTGDPQLDALLRAFQYERMGPYWPPGREWVDRHYVGLPFPFQPVPMPPFVMTSRWTRDALLNYIGTWSAVARCREVEGEDPLPALAEGVARAWPDAVRPREIRWPVYLLAGRA